MKKLSAFDNIKTPESWKRKALDTASFGRPRLKTRYEYIAAALTASLVIGFVGINALGRAGHIDDDLLDKSSAETSVSETETAAPAAEFVDPTVSGTSSKADTKEELSQKIAEHSHVTYIFDEQGRLVRSKGDGMTMPMVRTGTVVKLTKDYDRKTYTEICIATQDYVSDLDEYDPEVRQATEIEVYRLTPDTMFAVEAPVRKTISDEKANYTESPELNITLEDGKYKIVSEGVNGDGKCLYINSSDGNYPVNVGDTVMLTLDPSSIDKTQAAFFDVLVCSPYSEKYGTSGEEINPDYDKAMKAAKAVAECENASHFTWEDYFFFYARHKDMVLPEIKFDSETAKDMRVKPVTVMPSETGAMLYSVIWVRPDRDKEVGSVYAKYADYDDKAEIYSGSERICTVNVSADSGDVTTGIYAVPDPEDKSAFYVVSFVNNSLIRAEDTFSYYGVTNEYREVLGNVITMTDKDTGASITMDLDAKGNAGSMMTEYSVWKEAMDNNRRYDINSAYIYVPLATFRSLMEDKGILCSKDFNIRVRAVAIKPIELEKLYSMPDVVDLEDPDHPQASEPMKTINVSVDFE